jgi:hypothetical protein
MLRSLRRLATGLAVMLTPPLLSGCGGGGDTPVVGCGCPVRAPLNYLPVEATPSSDPDGGPTDLYVVPVNALTTAPTHVATYGWMLGVTTVTTRDGIPTKRFYTTSGENGGDHLWSLDLTEKSTLTPVQVSNVTFPKVPQFLPITGPGSVGFCTGQIIQGNLNDVDSATLIISLPNPDPLVACGEPGQILLIHPGDSATTAPTRVALGSNTLLPLYQATGALAGIVALDDAQNLNFYPDATFTHPNQLLSNVSAMEIWQETPSPGQHVSANPFYAYLVLKMNGATSPGKVHRIDATGVLSADLYDFQSPNDGVPVVTNDTVYFGDAGTVNVPPSIQVISHGMPAKTLYSYNRELISVPFLSGIAGQQLIFESRVDFQSPILVQALTIDGTGAPTTIASSEQFPDVAVSGNDVLITYADVTTHPVSYSTQIVDTSGAILRTISAGSAFLSVIPVLQTSNITTSPEIDVVDLSQPTANGSALKTPAGATFTLPANAFPILTPLTAQMGVGVVGTGTGPAGSWVYDLQTRTATQIVVPNFTVRID